MDVVAGLKRRARAALRRCLRLAAQVVSRRPGLVRAAARLLAAFPSLKHRIRRLVDTPEAPASRREDSLRPDQARVLVDLREAIADRQGNPR